MSYYFFFLNRQKVFLTTCGFCLAGLCIGVYCHLKQFFNYLLLLDLLKKEHPDIGCVFGNLNTWGRWRDSSQPNASGVKFVVTGRWRDSSKPNASGVKFVVTR